MNKLIMRIFVSGFLVTLFFLGSSVLTSAAEQGDLFEVDTEKLNMRTGPSVDEAIVGQLVEGNRLRIFDEKDGWVKTFYDGEAVWVSAHYLIYIEEEASPPPEDDVGEKEEPPNEEDNIDENEQKAQKKDYLISEIIGSKPIFVDIPKQKEENGELKTAKPRGEKVSEQSISITESLLENQHIVIDPGHGGSDPGAIQDGIQEKDLTLSTAEKIAEQLEIAGATVVLTREDDEYISLEERIQISHEQDADAFISIHYDSFDDSSVNGSTTYYYHDRTSLDLAKSIHGSIMQEVDIKDRGVQKTGYLVLRQNEKPSALLELGYMTNPDDLELIQTEAYQDQIATAITEGLIEYFGE